MPCHVCFYQSQKRGWEKVRLNIQSTSDLCRDIYYLLCCVELNKMKPAVGLRPTERHESMVRSVEDQERTSCPIHFSRARSFDDPSGQPVCEGGSGVSPPCPSEGESDRFGPLASQRENLTVSVPLPVYSHSGFTFKEDSVPQP